MATITEAANVYQNFFNGFKGVVLNTMKENSNLITEYITEQLFSGLNGDDKPLQPSYTSDPWFNSAEAGRWRGKEKQYMKWKKMITPPARSWLGYPERHADTPNLFINGEFYSTIAVTPFDDGVMIGNSTPLGGDIEQKYGSVIFKPGNKSVEHFVSTLLRPRLLDYLKNCGII